MLDHITVMWEAALSDANEDKLEVTVGESGASIKTAGSIVARTSNALLDAISPFTEASGAIGDVIHYFRQENALRALASAKKIAAECGIDASPVPPKFLVQWIEGASLEEPGTDDLADLWAGLLVSASQSTKPTHLTYKRILTEIVGRHVALLKWLANYDEAGHGFNFEDIENRYAAWNSAMRSEEVHHFDDYHLAFVAGKAEEVNSSGVKVYSIESGTTGSSLWYLKKRKAGGSHSVARGFVEDHSYKQLELMGILESVDGQLRATFGGANERGVVQFSAWMLTPLGVDFLKAVSPQSQAAADTSNSS